MLFNALDGMYAKDKILWKVPTTIWQRYLQITKLG